MAEIAPLPEGPAGIWVFGTAPGMPAAGWIVSGDEGQIKEHRFPESSTDAEASLRQGLASGERFDILLAVLPAEVADTEALERILEGLFGMARAGVTHMMRNRAGRILVIVSRAEPEDGLKQALIAAAEAFVRSLAREVEARGVAVNLVRLSGSERADREMIRFAALTGAVSGAILAATA